MTDPRVDKLASVLIQYSLEVKPGEQMLLNTSPLGAELALAAFGEAVKAGAFVYLRCNLPEAEEIFFKYASEAQLDTIAPIQHYIVSNFDLNLSIGAQENTRALSGIDPAKPARLGRAYAPLNKVFSERAASGALRWCFTVFPTHANAQEADMSLADYREFVFEAGKLNHPDPVGAWKAFGARQNELKTWLDSKDQVVLKGADIDLSLSIKERSFIVADGKVNFPDGEIFTGPVEESVNGWVRFKYPAIYYGREVIDVELWFENGKVVKEKASKNQEFLTSMLDTDQGSRFLGEWGIGTNYNITRFTKHMLFDEKLGGTIHFALGNSYPETGGKNESGLHWDLLCDMSQSEISVDGELFYKDGKPVGWSE